MQLILFQVLCFNISAQNLQGKVIDGETENALVGANVIYAVKGDTAVISTTSDGLFKIPFPANNINYLEVRYLGYQIFMTDNIPGDGDIFIIPLIINESNISVNPIIIANAVNKSTNISFNRKEFQLFPGAYEDPSRLLLKSPAISTTNDQANFILYKGMPTQFINWSINGLPIVNPNHTANAGSLSDISSINAGGVNMISGQVIGKYNFSGSPNDLRFNDALGAFSDVSFSSFDNNYLNLSLIGLEAGLGASNKKNQGIQLNYRYSTVGLLSNLGIDFGNEKIAYQDLFAKLVLVDNDKIYSEAFAILGTSFNRHTAVEDRQDAQIFKDLQDIDFDSQILLSGIKYDRQLSGGKLKFALNYSQKKDEWISFSNILDLGSTDILKQQLLSSRMLFEKNLAKGMLNIGANFKFSNDNRNRRVLNLSEKDQDFQNLNIFPYVNYQLESSNYLFDVGLGINYNSLTNNYTFDPKVEWLSTLNEHHNIKFAYRRNSQLLSIVNFSYDYTPEEIIGQHFTLDYNINYNKFSDFISFFYHDFSNILIETRTNYSQFTGLDHILIGAKDTDGKARTYGVSLGHYSNDLFAKGVNLTLNASLFKSEFQSKDETWHDNTYDFGQSYNAMLDYTRSLSKDRELVISLSWHFRGGLREFPINQVSSFYNANVVYDFRQSTTNKLAAYTRVDSRIVYNLRKGKHRKYAKNLSLDIQNLLNRSNIAYNYLDLYTGELSIQNQLGLIPIIAYRIEF